MGLPKWFLHFVLFIFLLEIHFASATKKNTEECKRIEKQIEEHEESAPKEDPLYGKEWCVKQVTVRKTGGEFKVTPLTL